MLIETLTVKQQKGKDSLVEIYQEVRQNWPKDDKILRFVSDQSLSSNSDRAWNVERAIKDYARERGYDTGKENKNEVIAVYNPQTHSGVLEYNIRQQVLSDPRFQVKKAESETARDEVNREFGIAIRQLKNLVKALEDKNEKELKKIRLELIEAQLSIISEIELPDELTKVDRERLTQPNWPLVKIETDNYTDYGQRGKLPESLNDIMTLLD